MTRFADNDQLSGPTFQKGYAAVPAGTSLLRARLSVYTWFNSNNAAFVFQNAPPNTFIGISWRAAGVAPLLITEANSLDASWYIAGPGEMTAVSDWVVSDTRNAPGSIFRERIWSVFVERTDPVFSAASMSFGISMNWLGSGFYTNNSSFFSYQFEAWYD